MSRQPDQPSPGWSTAKRLALPAVVAVTVALLLRAAGVRIYEVPGESMRPTLRSGDVVLASVVRGAPSRGEVIVFREPGSERVMVKRAIALPGDHILIRERSVILNGRMLVEPYADSRGISENRADLVPPNHVFLMGDNRADSLDSRSLGPVPYAAIESRVHVVLFSRSGGSGRILVPVR